MGWALRDTALLALVQGANAWGSTACLPATANADKAAAHMASPVGESGMHTSVWEAASCVVRGGWEGRCVSPLGCHCSGRWCCSEATLALLRLSLSKAEALTPHGVTPSVPWGTDMDKPSIAKGSTRAHTGPALACCCAMLNQFPHVGGGCKSEHKRRPRLHRASLRLVVNLEALFGRVGLRFLAKL